MTVRRLKPALFLAFCILLAPLCAGAASAAGEHEYVGIRKCRSCHKKKDIGNQYGVWLKSKHANAYETLASDQAKEWGADAGVSDPQTDEKCVECHVTAYGINDDSGDPEVPVEQGVGCEACHGAGKDYRKKKIMRVVEVAQEKGLVPQSVAVCTGCHNDKSPAWDPEAYTRADGTKAGFDYDAAVKIIAHPVPEEFDSAVSGEAE